MGCLNPPEASVTLDPKGRRRWLRVEVGGYHDRLVKGDIVDIVTAGIAIQFTPLQVHLKLMAGACSSAMPEELP